PARVLALMAGVALAALIAGLLIGRDQSGWTLFGDVSFGELLPFRAPRTLAAAAAGAMLAAAGVVLQRLTGNPLAGPEVLGVGAGAGVGLAVVYLTDGGASLGTQTLGSALGALAALAVLLALSGGRLGPERMLLAGAGISALCLAGLNAVIATGSRPAFALLAWMSGATDAIGPKEAVAACVTALLLIAPLALTLRWLEALQLGAVTARALGLRVR
ncbi:iron chelate uptake ABC transporter family permease subunit, partial [Methylopila musalis]